MSLPNSLSFVIKSLGPFGGFSSSIQRFNPLNSTKADAGTEIRWEQPRGLVDDDSMVLNADLVIPNNGTTLQGPPPCTGALVSKIQVDVGGQTVSSITGHEQLAVVLYDLSAGVDERCMRRVDRLAGARSYVANDQRHKIKIVASDLAGFFQKQTKVIPYNLMPTVTVRLTLAGSNVIGLGTGAEDTVPTAGTVTTTTPAAAATITNVQPPVEVMTAGADIGRFAGYTAVAGTVNGPNWSLENIELTYELLELGPAFYQLLESALAQGAINLAFHEYTMFSSVAGASVWNYTQNVGIQSSAIDYILSWVTISQTNVNREYSSAMGRSKMWRRGVPGAIQLRSGGKLYPAYPLPRSQNFSHLLNSLGLLNSISGVSLNPRMTASYNIYDQYFGVTVFRLAMKPDNGSHWRSGLATGNAQIQMFIQMTPDGNEVAATADSTMWNAVATQRLIQIGPGLAINLVV